MTGTRYESRRTSGCRRMSTPDQDNAGSPGDQEPSATKRATITTTEMVVEITDEERAAVLEVLRRPNALDLAPGPTSSRRGLAAVREPDY